MGGHKTETPKVTRSWYMSLLINHHHCANRRGVARFSRPLLHNTVAPHIPTGRRFTMMWHIGGLCRSVKPIVGLATLLVVVVLTFQSILLFHENNKHLPRDVSGSELHRRLQADLGAPRPKMHTYYEKAKTDMTDVADDDLLANWQKAWWDAGWEPVIITQWDAMNLPEYDDMIDLIVDPDFIGQYNMQCFIRYLAMSAVGGGWMS